MSQPALFRFYRDHAGEWRWRFVAANGRTMADSGEGYRTRQGAVRAQQRIVQIIQQWSNP